MKMVLAFVQPFKLDAVTHALEHLPDFPGMSVTHVGGFGREKHASPPRSVAEEVESFTDKVRIETVVQDEQADEVVDTVAANARTGRYGDGMVFVLPVERALRIMNLHEGEI